MPRISVLMPCYNVAGTLDETLQSLLAQTFTDLEIVAVDDGSEDATPRLLEDWERLDPRLRPLLHSHKGIIPAMNTGLVACRAPLVARMDADDWAHPQRLEKQATYMEEHPDVGLVASKVSAHPPGSAREGFRIYMEWLNSLLSDADIKRERFVESPLAHPSVMYRRQLVLNLGGYREHGWAEDYDLWLRLVEAGVTLAKLPEVLLGWRDHPGRLTRSDSRYSVKNFLRAKAHYLMRGPLQNRDAAFIWGAGMMGKRLSKHLLGLDAPIVAFIDIDPRKIGRTRRGKPVIAADDLLDWWGRYQSPVLLSAVGSRGARPLIRQQLEELGLKETQDWWAAA